MSDKAIYSDCFLLTAITIFAGVAWMVNALLAAHDGKHLSFSSIVRFECRHLLPHGLRAGAQI